MKAALWYGQRDIRIQEVPLPAGPAAGEVLLKVLRCGLCGTDLEEYLHGPIGIPAHKPHPLTGKLAPLIMGHEVVAEVVQLGAGVTRLHVGDRVIPDGLFFCGQCEYCSKHQFTLCSSMASIGQQTDGGLAGYMVVPEAMCVKIDRSVPVDLAALTEPLAVSIRAVNRSEMALGDRVAIVGVGTIGLCVLELSKMRGARTIAVMDKQSSRLERAARFGAQTIQDPQDASGTFDVVFECAGNPGAFQLALQLLAPGGTLVVVGATSYDVAINPLRLTLKEQTITTSLSHVYFDDTRQAVALLESGRLDLSHIITSVIPLSRVVEDGFERLASSDHDEIKILVDPTA